MMKFNIFIIGLIAAHAPASRIIGGKAVDTIDYPWMVSLRYNNKHHCGATLYDKDVIITAAHCLRQEVPDWSIGVPTSNDIREADIYEVGEVIRHPDYDKETYAFDAAICIIKNSVPGFKTKVELANSHFTKPGKELDLLGWGRKYRSASLCRKKDCTTKALRMTTIPVIGSAQCANVYDNVDFVSQFCAGLEEGGRDGCEGDSGGPLFYKHNQYHITLVGIMSSGAECASPGLPGVYTHANIVQDLLDIKFNKKYHF